MISSSTKTDDWVFQPTQVDSSEGGGSHGAREPARSAPPVGSGGLGDFDEDDPEADPPPERLGRFRILRPLGRGAMGVVLEGHDETLDRKVAVKLLREGSGGLHRKRLLREAQALARLSHPNVVAVYDAGEHQGRLYIAMELVDGQTLADWHKTPRPYTDCLRVYLEAGRGLMAAHAEGIVHRDFKPANCILDTQGRVKVLDFGLARGLDDEDDLDLERGRTADDDQDPAAASHEGAPTDLGLDADLSAFSLRLTRTGAMLGTPAYMAPEQVSGEPVDARTDQFGFCVALYEAVYGERPFPGVPGLALATGQTPRFGSAKRPTGLPAVPKWLEAALRRGLAARKDDRFATMGELLAALERGQRNRRWLGVGLLVGVGLLGGGAMAAMRDTPCEGLRDAPMAAWGEPQRIAVRKALLASASEHAERIWEATAAGLDEHAAAWADARATACEATRVERVAGEDLLELRMACLDRQAIQVAATVELLAEADHAMAAHAAQMVRSLPAVAPCLDAERLRSAPALPPALAEPAERIRSQVARSWAFDAAGSSQQGLAVAEQALEQAEALGPEAQPLVAEARYSRGRLYLSARRLAEARADLQAVLEQAEQAGDRSLAQDTLRELLLVAHQQGDHSAFEAWMTMARGKLQRRVDEPRPRAQLAYLEGLQALREGDAARAVERLSEAVQGHRERGPAASLAMGQALLQLGVAQGRLNQDEAAAQAFDRAQALAEREGLLLLLADVYQERGQVDFDRGRSEPAERWLRQSLELRMGFFGPTAPTTIPPRVQLAMLLQQRGEHEAALAMVDVVRDSLGPEVPARTRAQVMSLLARFHRQKGDWQAALDDYRGVEQALASLPTPDPVEQAMLHSNVADCLRVLRRTDAARTRYERAIEGLRIHAPADDFRRVYPLHGLARLLDDQGDTMGARDLYRRALAVHQAAPRDPEVGAMLRWKLARAVLTGPPAPEPERAQAREHLRDARQQYRALGDARMVAEIDAFVDECGRRCLAPPPPQSPPQPQSPPRSPPQPRPR